MTALYITRINTKTGRAALVLVAETTSFPYGDPIIRKHYLTFDYRHIYSLVRDREALRSLEVGERIELI